MPCFRSRNRVIVHARLPVSRRSQPSLALPDPRGVDDNELSTGREHFEIRHKSPRSETGAVEEDIGVGEGGIDLECVGEGSQSSATMYATAERLDTVEEVGQVSWRVDQDAGESRAADGPLRQFTRVEPSELRFAFQVIQLRRATRLPPRRFLRTFG